MTKTLPKSVAIIGFGPCGSATAKAFLAEGGYEITIFEKRPSSGGLWNYTLETDDGLLPVPCENPHWDPVQVWSEEKQKYLYASPVYNALDTNIPKQIMNFAGVPFKEELPLFPHHKDVLEYLKEYAEPYEKYVQYNTKVVDIVRNDSDSKWIVYTRKTNSKETKGGEIESQVPGFEDKSHEFDAILVATGNYELPYLPNRDGLSEWNAKYPGTVRDVKLYRSPSDYKDVNGKILVLGNSASANDLCFQIVQELGINVWKLKRSENNMPAGSSPLIIEVPDVKKFDAETKLVEFIDGSKIEDVGLVVYATGYLRSFPFFKTLNKSDKPIITDGIRVKGLYNHMLLYNYPNLAIIGVARYFLPTKCSESQASWLAKLWNGSIIPPLFEVMQKWEQDRIELKGDGRNFHDLLFPEDVKYANEINEDILKVNTGLIPFIWDKHTIGARGAIKTVKEAYIKYKAETGKLAKDYDELINNGYLESFTLTDEDLKKLGFNE